MTLFNVPMSTGPSLCTCTVASQPTAGGQLNWCAGWHSVRCPTFRLGVQLPNPQPEGNQKEAFGLGKEKVGCIIVVHQ